MTKNEISTGLNKQENFILALVLVAESEEFAKGEVFKV
jgi:hypothetical protein